MFPRTKRRLALLRALISYHLVAVAQMLCPASAADPSSRIDPPAWSQNHTQQELQSYGLRSETQERQKNEARRLSQVKLRRILENRGG
jgi:hypothetical protein